MDNFENKQVKLQSFRRFIDKYTRVKRADRDNIKSRIQVLDIPDTVGTHVVVDIISLLLSFYDERTASHSWRVAYIAEKISREFSRTECDHQRVHIAAYLHDIGKIAVPSSILNKPGVLTNEEFEIIKDHSQQGFNIISRTDPLSFVANIVLYHHERYDGRGYPNGLKGSSIPFDSRIISVADAFDAMTSDRPYHHSLNSHEALEEIRHCSGTQFDPEIVEAFEKMFLDVNEELANIKRI